MAENKLAHISTKFAILILVISLLLVLCACSHTDPVIDSLPNYKSKVFYSSGGSQDYTDYAKYSYESITHQELQASKYLKEVTAEDFEEILLHIENFEEWVQTIGDELKANYDFNKDIISEGDFFYIDTKADKIGQGSYGKFDNYSVYYFDIETQTLYYFHNNI